MIISKTIATEKMIYVMFFFMMICIPVTFSCGSNDNVFSSLVKKSEKDKAQTALQNGDYKEAAKQLKDYIAKNPGDNQARTMLASALMKDSSIDELSLASKISSATSSGNKASEWEAIVDVMPDGTAQNVENLKGAVDTLTAIPEDVRTTEQNYQLAMASASLAVAVVKKNTGEEGKGYAPTDENLDKISETDAVIIMDSIELTAKAGTASQAQGGIEKLTKISTDMNAKDGSSDKEKLISYLKEKRK